MDPEATLDEIRRHYSAFLAAQKRIDECRAGSEAERKAMNDAIEAADAALEAFDYLDVWMTRGGFKPAAWMKGG